MSTYHLTAPPRRHLRLLVAAGEQEEVGGPSES
jgi:hypothetical protein